MIFVKYNGGDSIYVEKRLFPRLRAVKDSFKTEEKTGYSIEDLKKQHMFE
jgi:hypothetical protein